MTENSGHGLIGASLRADMCARWLNALFPSRLFENC